MAEDNYSLSSRVFHSIRENILNGKYQANEELKEKIHWRRSWCQPDSGQGGTAPAGTGRTGTYHSKQGSVCRRVTLQDIKDIYEIRTLLEGLCARWAAERITQEQLEELEEIVFLSDFHYSKENWDQILELDNRFHEMVYEACASKELTRVLRDYHHYLQRIRRITLEEKARAHASINEHRAIAEALKARDARTAEECARLHIRNTISNMDKVGWENLMK